MVGQPHTNTATLVFCAVLCIVLNLGAASLGGPPPPPGDDNRIRFLPGGKLPEPERVRDPLPILTQQEWPIGLHKQVVLEISIDETGKIESIDPLRPPALDENHPILVGVREWRYVPPTFNEKPVRVLTLLFFSYSGEHGVCEEPYRIGISMKTNGLTPRCSGPSPVPGSVR